MPLEFSSNYDFLYLCVSQLWMVSFSLILTLFHFTRVKVISIWVRTWPILRTIKFQMSETDKQWIFYRQLFRKSPYCVHIYSSDSRFLSSYILHTKMYFTFRRIPLNVAVTDFDLFRRTKIIATRDFPNCTEKTIKAAKASGSIL